MAMARAKKQRPMYQRAGGIPTEIGHLTWLQQLVLNDTHLSGACVKANSPVLA